MESSVLNSNGQIIIPKTIRNKYKLKPGTKLIFIETKNGLILQPVDIFLKSQIGIAKSKDAKPMKIWWAEYKKEEKKLEEKKINLHN